LAVNPEADREGLRPVKPTWEEPATGDFSRLNSEIHDSFPFSVLRSSSELVYKMSNVCLVVKCLSQII